MAVLTTTEKKRLKKSSPVFRELVIADRMANLDSDGTYVGSLAGVGVPFVADTGGLSANQFGAVSGYDSTTGYMKLVKADADAGATARDLWFVPNAVSAAATGYAYKLGTISSVNTNAGTVGDPVYLSGTAGGWTLTKPTTGNQVEVGTIQVKDTSAGKINVDLEGDRVIPHDHSDNANGGTLTTPNLAGTTGADFTVLSGGATAKLKLDTNSATGNFTQSVSPANLSVDPRITLPDAPGGTASVVYTSAKQSVTASGSTSGSISIEPIAVGTNKTKIVNSSVAAERTLTLPEPGGNKYFAMTDQSDGTVVTTASTGTSNATFAVATNLVLSSVGQTGAHTFTFPDATGVVVTEAGTQTVSNKTITNPHLAGGAITLDAAVTVTGTWTNLGTVTTADINGGTIDGVTIGGAAAGAGTFTTVNASGTATFTGAITQTGNVTFGTGTGAVSLNGTVTIAAEKNLTASAGAGAVDFSAMTGTFKTSQGAVTLGYTGSSVTIPGTCTFATGTGAATLKGSATFDATKTLTFGSAAGGTANVVVMYSPTAARGGFTISVADNTTDHMVTLINGPANGGAATITTPGTTCTLAGLGLAQSWSGVQTFTAAPVSAIDDAGTNTVTDVLSLNHTSTGSAAAGFGVGVSLKLEDASGNAAQEAASIDAVWTTATHGSEEADLVFSAAVNNGTVTELMRLDASDHSLTLGTNATSAHNISNVRIFPVTASKGSLLLSAAANTGDTVTQIINAAFGQGTVLTVPDPAAATANFAYGDSSGKIAVANLADAVMDIMPTATATAGAEGGHKRTFTIQAKDAGGNSVTGRKLVRVWISGTEYAAPSATDNTVDNVTGGATIETVTAQAHYIFITDANGQFTFDLAVAGTTNRYVMMEVEGRVTSSGAVAYD